MTHAVPPTGWDAPLQSDATMAPGDLVRRQLETSGITQAELAVRAGLSAKHVNQVIQGVAPLSAETALALERTLGISADLLNRLEANHRGHLTRVAARSRLAPFVEWAKGFPITELRAAGLLPRDQDDVSTVESLLRLFRVADPASFEKLWGQGAFSFRRAQHLDGHDKTTATWLRVGEIRALPDTLPSYDAAAFAELTERLPNFVLDGDDAGFHAFVDEARAAGVGISFVPGFGKTRSHGATRWLPTGNPTIVMSDRYKYSDIFWFSLAHETVHVLRHPKRKSNLHLDTVGDNADGLEREADTLAADLLIRHADRQLIAAVTAVPAALALAAQLKVDVGVIAGQVCHLRGGKAWQTFARLRRTLTISVS